MGYLPLQIGNSFLLGTYHDGIVVSTDSGLHWKFANNGLTELSILSLWEFKGVLFTGTYNGWIINPWILEDHGFVLVAVICLIYQIYYLTTYSLCGDRCGTLPIRR